MLSRRSWPMSPANQLRSELDQFFANFLGNPGGSGLDVFPPVNVWEEKDTLYVEAELPGVEKDNLELTVVENELIIKGQYARQDAAGEGKTYYRRERPVGSFTRDSASVRCRCERRQSIHQRRRAFGHAAQSRSREATQSSDSAELNFVSKLTIAASLA